METGAKKIVLQAVESRNTGNQTTAATCVENRDISHQIAGTVRTETAPAVVLAAQNATVDTVVVEVVVCSDSIDPLLPDFLVPPFINSVIVR